MIHLFQLKVKINGKAIPRYCKDTRTFIEGQKGCKFSLELTNLTNKRLLVHPFVDGLSVMTGERASRSDSSNGYILDPYKTQNIQGWRLNDRDVAQFFFAGKGRSYTEKAGKGTDKGVIACSVWKERQVIQYRGNSEVLILDEDDLDDFLLSGKPYYEVLPTPSFNLGTGFGAKTKAPIRRIPFDVDTIEPAEITVLYYDDCAGLIEYGIKPKQASRFPNPFPKDIGCKPPKGWWG